MPKYFPLPVKAVYLRIKTQDMNREILRLAVPNIISNITVPLMGIVSSAVAGHLDNSAATIGALAIGVSIFNFIYWNCSFVRMGTSGLTAQAFGAGNFHECTNMPSGASWSQRSSACWLFASKTLWGDWHYGP